MVFLYSSFVGVVVRVRVCTGMYYIGIRESQRTTFDFLFPLWDSGIELRLAALHSLGEPLQQPPKLLVCLFDFE